MKDFVDYTFDEAYDEFWNFIPDYTQLNLFDDGKNQTVSFSLQG